LARQVFVEDAAAPVVALAELPAKRLLEIVKVLDAMRPEEPNPVKNLDAQRGRDTL
jgi:hypothetical protein